MTALTHVLFDFFGTLVAYSESRSALGLQRSHELLTAGGAVLDYAEFLGRWDRTWDEFESRAQRSHDEFSMTELCTSFMTQALRRDPDEETVAEFRDTFLAEWNKGVRYIPGVREMLAELAEQFVLVLVTNTHHAELVHGHLRAMNIGGYFSRVVTSVEHGKRKPSACIFERALAESSGRAGAAAYVGDSFAADYLGAGGAGLRCLLIDPERRHDVREADRLKDILEVRARLAGD
jgi:putative hydrolase of the HAD superfamily